MHGPRRNRLGTNKNFLEGATSKLGTTLDCEAMTRA